VKYEVDYAWGGLAWPQEDQEDASTPADMANTIKAVYDNAAYNGGRVIALHTLIFEGLEHLFFVSEFPDDAPVPVSTPDES
jgi:hypothetical protein